MKEIAKVLYGSQNYGLDTPESDRDYKVLLVPSFRDLYEYHKADVGDLPPGYDKEHYSPMTVMQFHSLLMKGNPNCLEMLYSVEWDVKDRQMLFYIAKARELFGLGYIALVWDKFYAALKGLAMNGIDRYGLIGKSVSRAWYMFQLGNTIEFFDFKVATDSWRNIGEGKSMCGTIREEAKKIRDGEYDLSEIAALIKSGFESLQEHHSESAKDFIEANPKLVYDLKCKAQRLDDIMYNLVKESIADEIE